MQHKIIVVIGCLILSMPALAGTVGFFVVAPDAVSGEAESGRVVYISDSRFSEVTSSAKKGDRIDLAGETFEVLVVVPGQVLTVIDTSSRSEVRVLVNASAAKK